MAAVLMMSIPVLAIFLFSQRLRGGTQREQ